jgi:hypothetical protein
MQRWSATEDGIEAYGTDGNGYGEYVRFEDVQALAKRVLPTVCKCGCSDELIAELRAIVGGKG